VTLALAAPDRARALDLIGRWGPLLQTDRRRGTVDRWLAAFTDDEILTVPVLATVAAWNAFVTGDAAGVHRCTAALEPTAPDARLPDGSPVHAASDLLRALTTARGLTE